MPEVQATFSGRRWARNTISQIGVEVGVRGLQIATVVVLARSLGPSGLGRYTLAMVLLGFTMVFARAGLDVVGMREVAEHPDSVRQLAKRISLVQLRLALIGVLVLVVAGALLQLRLHNLVFVLAAMSLYLIPNAFNIWWAFIAIEEVTVIAGARLLSRVCFLIAAVSVVGRSVTVAAFAWSGSGFVEAGALWVLLVVMRKGSEPALGSRMRWPDWVKRGLPFTGAQLTSSVYFGLDQALLGLVAGSAALGGYAAVYNLSWPAVALAGVFFSPSYPGLVRSYRRCGSCFWNLAVPLGKLISVVGVGFAGIYLALAPSLLPSILGSSYHPGRLLIWLLGLATALAVSRTFLMTLLIVPHLDKRYLVVSASVMLADAVGVAALAPAFGATGAAGALVAAEVVGICVALAAWRGRLLVAFSTLSPWLALAPFVGFAVAGWPGAMLILVICLAWLVRAVPAVMRSAHTLVSTTGV